MGGELRVSSSDSTSIYDALSFKSQKPVNVASDDTDTNQVVQTQDSTETEKPTKGRIPATNFNFDNPVIEQPIQEKPMEQDSGDLPSLDKVNQNTNEINNQNPDDLPALFDIKQDTTVPENNDYTPQSSKNHSTSKALVHFEAGLLKKAVVNTASWYIKKSTANAVEKELTAVIANIAAKKVAAKTGITVAEKLATGASEGVAKTIASVTGKGVATLTVKEAAAASGNVIKGLSTSAKAASEILLKDGATKIVQNSASALVKTSIGASEKALQVGMEKGTQIAVKKVLVKAGEEVTGKVASKTLQKEASVAVTKATAEVATKTGSKWASKAAAAAPWIGAAIGTAVTAWDAKDAYDKSKDPKASTVSKVLAWSTVGLDAVSTATTATGVGAPVGWVATGLSIGTSVLSDYLR